MEQDFHGDFQVNVEWFFASFSGVLDSIVLILVWFERSLHSTQVSGQNLKLMTSQVVEETWIRTGGYGRLMGEWVSWENFGVVYRWSVMGGGRTWRFDCNKFLHRCSCFHC